MTRCLRVTAGIINGFAIKDRESVGIDIRPGMPFPSIEMSVSSGLRTRSETGAAADLVVARRIRLATTMLAMCQQKRALRQSQTEKARVGAFALQRNLHVMPTSRRS